jgi:hypothetical protein
MDLTTPLGFLHALGLCLRLKPGGLLWAAPPCSTFVWMNRGTSQRSTDRAEGNESVPSVAASNIIVARLMLLIALVVTKGCNWMLEQPTSSVMVWMRRMQAIKENLGMCEVFTWMGAFGAATPKGTRLYGNNAAVLALLKRTIKRGDFKKPPKGQETNLRHRKADGRERVRAGPGLKGTQAYPVGFGIAVAAAISTSPIPTVRKHIDVSNDDSWGDARLGEGEAFFESDD